MPRPRKPAAEKLVPVSTNLPPDVYAAIERVASARHVKVARVLRLLITQGFRNLKTQVPTAS